MKPWHQRAFSEGSGHYSRGPWTQHTQEEQHSHSSHLKGPGCWVLRQQALRLIPASATPHLCDPRDPTPVWSFAPDSEQAEEAALVGTALWEQVGHDPV